jgi:hypothetical protein
LNIKKSGDNALITPKMGYPLDNSARLQYSCPPKSPPTTTIIDDLLALLSGAVRYEPVSE